MPANLIDKCSFVDIMFDLILLTLHGMSNIRLKQVKHSITTSQISDHNKPNIDYNKPNIRLQQTKHTITRQTYDYNKTNIRFQQGNHTIITFKQVKHSITTSQIYDYNKPNIRLQCKFKFTITTSHK